MVATTLPAVELPGHEGAFARVALPKQFCNLDRLLFALRARGLDGIVATLPYNVFYLTGFNAIAHKADEPRPYALVLSRHAPDRPILVIADYYLGTFLKQPTWVEDIRPFRAVMMPLDLPATRGDIDRFIPKDGSGAAWVERSRRSYAFDMGSAVRGALADLKLDGGRVAFDDMGAGFRLGVQGMQVADGYDPLMFARAVKTDTELRLLERSTRLNETAIRRTMASWQKGATWRDLNKAYAGAVTGLGGFVRDPGAMVWGHPRGADPAMTLATGLEDDEVDARHPRDVRLPRHHRSLLLGRRQDLGGGRRARGRRQAVRQGHGAGGRGAARGHASRRRGSASCRRTRARSTAVPACRTRLPPSSSSTASACRTWTSSRRWPTAARTATGCWRKTWSHPCTCSIRAASTSASGSRRWCTSPRTAAARCSPGASSRWPPDVQEASRMRDVPAATRDAPRILPVLGWMTAALFFFYAWVLRVAPSVMVEELMRDFAVGAAVLGNLSAAYFYGYAGMQIPVGVLLDRFGPRRLVAVAALLCAGGCVLFATGTTLAAVTAGRFLIGASAAFSLVGAMCIAGQWFSPSRFALSSGLAMAAGMAGGVLGQAPLRLAVEATDWRTTMLLLAVGGVALSLAAWAFIRDRWRGSGGIANVLSGLRIVASHPQTWLIALPGLGTAAPLLGFAGLWGVPFLETAYGLPRTHAATLTSLVIAGFGVGAPVLGWLSDRIGRRKPPVLVGLALQIATLSALIYVPDLPVFAIGALCFLTGVFGSSQIVCFALAKENSPRRRQRHGDRLRQLHGDGSRRAVPAPRRAAARLGVGGPDRTRRARVRHGCLSPGAVIPGGVWHRRLPVPAGRARDLLPPGRDSGPRRYRRPVISRRPSGA